MLIKSDSFSINPKIASAQVIEEILKEDGFFYLNGFRPYFSRGSFAALLDNPYSIYAKPGNSAEPWTKEKGAVILMHPLFSEAEKPVLFIERVSEDLPLDITRILNFLGAEHESGRRYNFMTKEMGDFYLAVEERARKLCESDRGLLI